VTRKTWNVSILPFNGESDLGPTGREHMRIGLSIVGLLLVLLGGIWVLQGINVLPGSFMTGQIRWAVYGGIAIAAGIVLLLRANRRRTTL